MSLLLLAGLPFSWVVDTARDLRQAYDAWRTSARSYVHAHSRRQVGLSVHDKHGYSASFRGHWTAQNAEC